MNVYRKLIVSLALILTAASARADVFVSAFTGQFGTMDPATGAFTPIGPVTPDPLGGLVSGTGGYLGVSFSGNLDAVNPATGAVSVIGATGLGGLAFTTGELNGIVYATDLNNNLYTINTKTGVASLIGPSGLPPCLSLTSPTGLSDEALFSAGGNLYMTFDGFDAVSMAVVYPAELYKINPTTAVATLVGPTAFGLDAAVDLNGTAYGFTADNQVVSLDPATGNTSFVTNYDPAANFVDGAAVAPEPGYFALVGVGFAAIFIFKRQRRHSQNLPL